MTVVTKIDPRDPRDLDRDPDLTIDTTSKGDEKCRKILAHIVDREESLDKNTKVGKGEFSFKYIVTC